MANKQLFQTMQGAFVPAAVDKNREGAPAYKYSPKHLLAQYAVTGCLNNTFYASGEYQLAKVLELSKELDAEFIAKTAVYARESASMKDMPALLLAVLSTKSPEYLRRVFDRVVDNGRMLRNFVQILRSGAVGRKSLGSAPKELVKRWLSSANDRRLIEAAVGSDPSLADIVRMVHPKPNDRVREAFYGWLLGKPYALEALPQKLQEYVVYKFDRSHAFPDVPFQMLTALGLKRDEWAMVARRGNWHMVRMNLNTFARHGVFEIDGMAQVVADKLRDPEAIEKARVLPYQLLAAYRAAGPDIPNEVREALQDAMELALLNIGKFAGRVVVCPDVSGSMSTPATGLRKGASSAVRCIDVAGLVAAAVVRANRNAIVMPFENVVRSIVLNTRDSVMTNAEKLAAIGGGGTNCSAPLRSLNARNVQADLVIFVSDNQSWADARNSGATEMMRHWAAFKARNSEAKLVCIDIQPHGTSQALERADVLNVGGFSDEVFNVVNAFAAGKLSAGHWTAKIEEVLI
ncbi:RNA-binding protein [Steroidobacter flavus]|uniref:RNA-binding protein n=1 Tax=Steroidobacter flavus TaxID=1842136 RepID=A0ABV8T2K8_9GAMM